jgi:beta-lactamase regulating signal transducer with metallopeptidase domain
MDILQMSFSASLLIVFIVAVRFFFKNKITSNIFDLLWIIVCFKLLVPFSVFSLLEQVFNVHQFAKETEMFEIPLGFYYVSDTVAGFNLYALKNVWVVGVLIIILYFLHTYIRCISVFKMALPVKNISFINQWYKENSLYRNVSIRMSDHISSPLTYGIFCPIILLPKKINWEDEENLFFILEHEMAHIRRWDCLRKLCLTAVVACHWFNPLVYLMYFLANRDIELACDENVIRNIGIGKRAAYSTFLLEWKTTKTKGNIFISYLIQNSIKERIVNIMNIKKISAAGIMLSVSLIAASATIYAVTPSSDTVTAESSKAIEISLNQLENNDPTLGGIFEVYTPEEYADVIENIKNYSDGAVTAEDIKSMEEDLDRLIADNGKGEFVIYKGAFRVDKKLENGAMLSVALNPTIIMNPELLKGDISLTAESYKGTIEDVSKSLDEAVENGSINSEQKQIILNKMNENLLKLK